MRQQVAAFERRAAHLDAVAGQAAVAYNNAMDRRDHARAQAAVSRFELARSRVALASAREGLARRLVRLYARPDPDLMDLVVGSGSLTELVSTTGMLQGAADRDARLVAAVRERRAALRAVQGRLTRAVGRADAEYAVASRERERLEGLLAEQRSRLGHARATLRRALASRRAGVVRLALAKGTAVRAAGSVATNGVEPVFPVAAPTTFGDDWLAPRGGRYHEGIDLMAARGAPIVAVVTGTLFRVGTSPISGNRLWLRGSNGDEYFFAHLDGFAPVAGEGAQVRAGTVIGYVGDTGDARGTTPHLHFEIHPGGGGPIRPYPLVSAWPRVG